MLIITTSPSTSAVSTEGLREITVASAMAASASAGGASSSVGMVLHPSMTGRAVYLRTGAKSRPPNPSRIRALDPAQEAADMDAAGQHELIVLAAFLSRVLVHGPLRHQTLQARHVEQAARKRGG